MQHATHISIVPIVVLAMVIALAIPYLGNAQESTDELRATIRGAILSDPRTSSLSETQIDTVVNVLTQEAEKQGMTSQDIQWRPQSTERFFAAEGGAPTAAECAGGFLCTMTEALGFVGADTTIPFTLGAASMGLVWILAEMIHRRRHPMAAPSTPVSGI